MNVNTRHSITRWQRWFRLVVWWLFIVLIGVVAIFYMAYSEDFLLHLMMPWLDGFGCHPEEPDGRRGSCAGLAVRVTAVMGLIVLIAYGRRLFVRVAAVLGLEDAPKRLGPSQGLAAPAKDGQIASMGRLPWSQVRLSGSLGLAQGSASLFLVGEQVIYCWSRVDASRLVTEAGGRIDAVCQRLPNGECVLLAYRVGEDPAVRAVGVVLMGRSLLVVVGGMLLSWLLGQRTLMLGFGAFLVFDLVCIGLSYAAYRVLASSQKD